MPSTSPLVQSMQTHDPPEGLLPVFSATSNAFSSPSSHARWTLRSMVSLMSLPGFAGTAPAWPVTLPSASTLTVCSPRMPCNRFS